MFIEIFSGLFSSFFLGLLTPLTAVCVLPLYPGFLIYLANNVSGKESSKKMIITFGLLIVLGVVTFMLSLGIIFSLILEISLTHVIGIISPIAFGILVLISLFLIFNFDIGKYIPKSKMPQNKNPFLTSYLFGLFFGAIVVPCNPLFIAALFARGLSIDAFSLNVLNFLFFGFGIGAPLIVFSLLSLSRSQSIIALLVKHKTFINRTAGIIMLIISLYYLIFVF